MEIYLCPFCGKKIKVDKPNSISNHMQWRCPEWKKYKEEILTKDFLYKEHWVKGKSCNEIAKEHNIRSSCSINKLLNKYGLGTRNIKQSKNTKRVKEKTEKTNIERYGEPHNFSKNHPSRKKWEQRLKDDEGISNVFQRESVKRKIVAHHIEKYGYENHMQSSEFQKKFFDKYEEKHGYRYPIQSPNNKFGGTVSKPQLKVLNELQKRGYKLKKEFTIYPYRVDIILEKRKKIIEVYGDYWHANPNKYKADDKIQFPKQTNITSVKEIWDRDSNRISYIENAGYDVFIAWEYDINKNFKELIINIEKFLNNENSKN